MSKVVGNCIAGALCVIAFGAIVAPKIPSMIAAAMEEGVVEPEPIDQETLSTIMQSLDPGVEFIPSEHASDEHPSYVEMMEEDAPDVFIDFVLATGHPGQAYTLAEVSRIIAEESSDSVDTISRELFDGQCIERGETGYVRQIDFPAYYYANYKASTP